MSVLPVHVQHEFNSNAYSLGVISQTQGCWTHSVDQIAMLKTIFSIYVPCCLLMMKFNLICVPSYFCIALGNRLANKRLGGKGGGNNRGGSSNNYIYDIPPEILGKQC